MLNEWGAIKVEHLSQIMDTLFGLLVILFIIGLVLKLIKYIAGPLVKGVNSLKFGIRLLVEWIKLSVIDIKKMRNKRNKNKETVNTKENKIVDFNDFK